MLCLAMCRESAGIIGLTQQVKHRLMKYLIALQVYWLFELSEQVARRGNFRLEVCKLALAIQNRNIDICVFHHNRQLQNIRFWAYFDSFIGTLAAFPWHDTCCERYKLLLHIVFCLWGFWHWTLILSLKPICLTYLPIQCLEIHRLKLRPKPRLKRQKSVNFPTATLRTVLDCKL